MHAIFFRLGDATSSLDLIEVFKSSPVIYCTLLTLSLFSFVLWLYSLFTLKMTSLMPEGFLKQVREQFLQKKYDAALLTCQRGNHFSATILASGISSRNYGAGALRGAMEAEGKRCGVVLWQRLSLLNDIAIIAPMLGLLGTVLGLFYAFYDVNRTPDTLASIFDGLGIAVGTTVAGLIVAILAMVFHTILKFRVIRLLNQLESETLALSHLIEVS